MEPPTVIFLHIPKAAGTTLHRIIEQQYRPQQIYSTYPTLFNPAASIEDFRRLSPERHAKVRMLKGHVPYGVHAYLPGPAVYFTLLREPIDRVISFYYFIRQNPKHYLHEALIGQGLTLADYVERRLSTMTDNFQVRMLTNTMHDIPNGGCTADMLETAQRNLHAHFAVVGLSERFDETLMMLRRAFHWHRTYYIRQNVTAVRPKVREIPAELTELIRQHNLLDIELYASVKSEFEARLNQVDATFTQELQSFQVMNQRLQPLLRTYWRMRQYSLRAWLHTRTSS
jgi:hypothetical protein